MRLEIGLQGRHLAYLILALSVLTAINYAIAQSPPDPGHSWSEVACSECIQGPHIADGAVSDVKLASGISWSKLVGVPSGLADGDHDTKVTCGWTGTRTTKGAVETIGCSECCPSYLYCTGSCQQTRQSTTSVTCDGSYVTDMDLDPGTWGACTCTGGCTSFTV